MSTTKRIIVLNNAGNYPVGSGQGFELARIDFTNLRKSGCQLKKTLDRWLRAGCRVHLISALSTTEQEMALEQFINRCVKCFSNNLVKRARWEQMCVAPHVPFDAEVYGRFPFRKHAVVDRFGLDVSAGAKSFAENREISIGTTIKLPFGVPALGIGQRIEDLEERPEMLYDPYSLRRSAQDISGIAVIGAEPGKISVRFFPKTGAQFEADLAMISGVGIDPNVTILGGDFVWDATGGFYVHHPVAASWIKYNYTVKGVLTSM